MLRQQSRCAGSTERLGKVIALAVFAPKLSQARQLFGRLHPFGNDIETKIVRHGQDGASNLHAFISLIIHAADKRTINLQRVQGEAV